MSYPGGLRPSSVVTIAGGGRQGLGEHVGWELENHLRFAERCGGWLPVPGRGPVGDLADAIDPAADAYARTALEGALIDLALKQAGESLPPADGLRTVISTDDLATVAAHPGASFKVDVDPAWTDDDLAALAQIDLVVLDFKERGDATLATRLRRAFPRAIFEDPPPGAPGPVALDRPILTAGDAALAARSGRFVNLKAPRMGGFRELLRALDACSAAAYFGGMFEVGPGRALARQLAAMFTPAAPNDLALLR